MPFKETPDYLTSSFINERLKDVEEFIPELYEYIDKLEKESKAGKKLAKSVIDYNVPISEGPHPNTKALAIYRKAIK